MKIQLKWKRMYGLKTKESKKDHAWMLASLCQNLLSYWGLINYAIEHLTREEEKRVI